MAKVVNTGSVNVGSSPASSATAYVTLQGNSYSGYSVLGGDTPELAAQWGLSVVTENTDIYGFGDPPSGSWTQVVGPMNADTTYKFRARDDNFGINGTTKNKKTAAMLATASTPTSSSVTATTATIACNYYPNVNESTSSAQLQYKKSSDSTWTNAGTANTTGGYAQVNESEAITGLTASTQYQVRLVVTRAVSNTDGQSLTSATATFTTLAGAPTVTTDAESGVGATGATLNGTLTINSASGVTVYFKWGESNPPTENTTTAQSKSASGAFSDAITGLTASTTYYYKAYAAYTSPPDGSSPAEGDVGSLTTTADPGADAANQELLPVLKYDRKYGVATTVYFVSANSEAAAQYDTFYTGAPLWDGAGECKISKDGAAFADTTADPAQVEDQLYSVALSATEMQCNEAVIIISNGGTTARDVLIRVRTHLALGSVDIDAATGQKANTTAFKATGYGSGHGIQATAGATGHDIDGLTEEMVLLHYTLTAVIGGTDATHIDFTSASGVSGSNDFYNGDIVAIIAGTGAGQARTITDYVGASNLATVDTWTTTPAEGSAFIVIPGPKDWDVTPGAELSTVPTYMSGYGKLLQFLFQRFVYKHTQDAVSQRLYKDDAATVLGTSTYEDTGTGQIVGEVK